jgi:hypothetical protein
MHHFGQVSLKEHAARVMLLVMPPSTMGRASITASVRHSSCRFTVSTGKSCEEFDSYEVRLRRSQ